MLRDSLEHIKGKFRNVVIVGPANLKPIGIIFLVFTNPTNNKYALAGAAQAGVIVLQNFRWSSELICWKDLLLLLEGKNKKLPSPKTQFATNVWINTDIPIFATSKVKTEFVGKNNTCDDRETEMMDVRWNIFEFTTEYHKQIKKL